MSLFFMALASVAEGGVLAYFQYRLIEKAFPQIAWKQWLTYTVAAALVCWMLGILPSRFLIPGGAAISMQASQPLAYYSVAGLIGLLLGAVFGYFHGCR